MGSRMPSSAMPSLDVSSKLTALVTNAARFVANAKPIAQGLQNSLINLQSATNSQVAVSSNTNALTVAFTGSSVPHTSVLVHQIAKTQQNQGNALNANNADIPSGTHRFEIKIDGNRHEISFTTNQTTTNLNFQQQMATAINQANIGITASVSTASNKSTLKLEASQTGAGKDNHPKFTIKDIDGTAVKQTAVNNIIRDGQDAVFIINGNQSQTYSTNNIDLGGGLNITLLSAYSDAIVINAASDAASIQNSLRHMVSHFNSLLEAARANPSDISTQRLVRNLERSIRVNRRSLANMGISTSQTGILTINDDKLKVAAQNGIAQSLLQNNNNQQSSLISRLSNIAQSISQDPMRHISRQASNLPAFNVALNALINPNNTGRRSSFDT